MANAVRKKLSQIQEILHDTTVPGVRDAISRVNREVNAYSQRFAKSLPQQPVTETSGAILDSILANKIVLFGDFHTHKQSQKEYLRVIEQCMATHPQPMVMALECFRACDMEAVDAYMSGMIDDDALHHQIDYHFNWGFPWINYQRVLLFARSHRLKVVGINSPGAGRDRLKIRDQFMAEAIASLHSKQPDALVFCLVGEFHLADPHLPLKLKSLGLGPVTRVLVNVDSYHQEYLRQVEFGASLYLKLKQEYFCVMNSSPWLKWQSFAIWQDTRRPMVERTRAEQKDVEGWDLDQELDYDVDSQFYDLTKVMAQYFQTEFSEFQLTNFHIFYVNEGLGQNQRLTERFGPKKLQWLEQRMSYRSCIWDQRSRSLVLSRLNTNVLSEGAGAFLFDLIRPSRRFLTEDMRFFETLFSAAFAVFCSKVINPQRSFMRLEKLVTRYRASTSKDVLANERPLNHVERLVARHLIWLEKQVHLRRLSIRVPQKALFSANARLHDALAYRLGQLWGDFIFRLHVKEDIDSKELVGWLLPPAKDMAGFMKAYENLALRLFVDSVPMRDEVTLKR
jgi:hypothetical protein